MFIRFSLGLVERFHFEPVENQNGSKRTGLITSFKTSFKKKTKIKRFYILIFPFINSTTRETKIVVPRLQDLSLCHNYPKTYKNV